ncbi:hypothetical protein AMECASPLE_029650, partial [Ameca splendens]
VVQFSVLVPVFLLVSYGELLSAPAPVSAVGRLNASASVCAGGQPDASVSAPAQSPDSVPEFREGFEDKPPPLPVPVPEGFEDEPPPSLEPHGLRRRSSGLRRFLHSSPEPHLWLQLASKAFSRALPRVLYAARPSAQTSQPSS